MKIGMSSYCLDREIEQGCMTLPECIDWAARQGADCLELVPFAFRFDDPATGKIDASLIKSVRRRAQDAFACKAADQAGNVRIGQGASVRDDAAQIVSAHRLDRGVAVRPRREARPHADDAGRVRDARAEVSLG